MAAPAHTSRTTPTGFHLSDGFKSLFAFALAPAVKFWEIEVQPFGYDGGEPNAYTTQHNTLVRTFRPKKLITVTPMSIVAAYDPDVLPDIRYLINREGACTQWFPDNSYDDMYAYLQSFKPQKLKEGDTPLADIMIAVTNWDPVSNVEAAPVRGVSTGTF